MLGSGSSRITKRTEPEKPIKRHKYRDALPNLMADFEGRCAYSLQHVDFFGGIRCMEVDHFNPNKKKDLFQDYDNLLPASRNCNGTKRDFWPTASEVRRGIRFLHPREELDYGPHIVEEVSTGVLVGLTPAGKWQIRMCGLNARHLINERKRRTKIINILKEKQLMVFSGTPYVVDEAIKALMEQLALMIPELPKTKISGQSNQV